MVRSIPAGTPRASAGIKASLTSEVADLLGTVARRIRRVANQELDPLGVTSSQVKALRVLARHRGAVRMRDIATDLRIARRTATSIVDDLVDAGLAERRADPSDRRGVAVTMTAAGVELLDQAATRRHAAAAALTDALTRAELTQLRDLLRRIDTGAAP